jgi:hypothetical protein
MYRPVTKIQEDMIRSILTKGVKYADMPRSGLGAIGTFSWEHGCQTSYFFGIDPQQIVTREYVALNPESYGDEEVELFYPNVFILKKEITGPRWCSRRHVPREIFSLEYDNEAIHAWVPKSTVVYPVSLEQLEILLPGSERSNRPQFRRMFA